MKWAFWVLRKLLRIPPPRISREQALQIAKADAEKWGTGVGKTAALEGLRRWIVLTHSDTRGSPCIYIDNQTGDVLERGATPR